MLAMLLATAHATIVPPGEIDRAIAMGRLDQARMMIAARVRAGASGDAIERPMLALAFAAGRDEEALARAAALLHSAPDDPRLLEIATIAAARTGKHAQALAFGKHAASLPGASWRVWNALGVLADRVSDWPAADEAYARADRLAPARAEVANNRGWSLLLRGDWNGAVEPLAKAAALNPRIERAAHNLDLARMGLAGELPARAAGESNADYAARLNDAGVAAILRGQPVRARAAFAQAIHASARWYARASVNLAAVEGAR